MFVSVDTGARLPEPLGINTVACPCAVPFEYCCCAGCPRGTCRLGFIESSPLQLGCKALYHKKIVASFLVLFSRLIAKEVRGQ